MTDGSEGADQLIFASRAWNLEQSIRQWGWATFWWQWWTEKVHDKLLPLFWLLQLWAHMCARPGWRSEEHSCDATRDGSDIVLEWTVQKSQTDWPIRGLHHTTLSLTYLVPNSWATLGHPLPSDWDPGGFHWVNTSSGTWSLQSCFCRGEGGSVSCSYCGSPRRIRHKGHHHFSSHLICHTGREASWEPQGNGEH